MNTTASHLLIVDDDAAHRLLIKHALKGIAAPILEAGSAKEAREVLAKHGREISLVILDMNLEGAPSLAVLQAIRATFSFEELPVVLLSTSALDPDVQHAYRAGANCYLVKSGDAAEFRDVINHVVHFFAGIGRAP